MWHCGTQERVQFLVRGVGTNFLQEVDKGDTVIVFHSDEQEEQGAVALTVESLINDVM